MTTPAAPSPAPTGLFASPDELSRRFGALGYILDRKIATVLYLAADDSRFVTGSTVTIDAGSTNR